MLARNKRVLAEAGVCYPALAEEDAAEGHPSLAWEILEDLGLPSARLSSSRLTWRDALGQADAQGAHTLLLSAEDFTLDEFEGPALDRLTSLLGADEVVVVYGLRHPARLIPSIWQQAVRWGLGRGEELQEFGVAAPRLIERYRRSSTLYLGRKVAALDHAILRPFIVPTAPGDAHLMRFLEAAGIDHRSLDFGHTSTPVNKSIGYSQLRLLLQLNRISPISVDPLDKAALLAREFVLAQLPRDSAEADSIPLTLAVEAELRDLAAYWRHLVQDLDLVGDIEEILTFTKAARPTRLSNDLAPELALSRALVELARYARDAVQYTSEVIQARDWWRSHADDAARRLEDLGRQTATIV